MPKVSVLIPTYNCAKYIGQAIQSVLDQTFADFEIIISDNASTDNTEEVVGDFKDQRIKYIRNNENIGFTSNVYKLLEMGKGEYGTILCADDFYGDNDLLARMVRLLETYEDVSFVHTGCLLLKEIDGTKIPIVGKSYSPFTEGYRFIEEVLTLYSCNIFLSSGMFRLKYALSIPKAYEFHLITDLWLWLNMALYGRVAYIPEALVVYRRHPNSLTYHQLLKERLDDMLFLQKYFELIGDRVDSTMLSRLKRRAFKKYTHYHIRMLPAVKSFGVTNKVIYKSIREIAQYNIFWIFYPNLLARACVSLLPYEVVSVLKRLYLWLKKIFLKFQTEAKWQR